ncbi:MAG TPA: type II toxin-antitoxin system HicB family antitoxin [Candidatus Deferrimicrobium sp.]|nr:type II toxin-antitoxin system HicB family antitoxin [Candidatus Deferrimicrobium sp.]
MIEIDEDGYFIVSCPSFKRCHSYGETIDDAL